ncbi:aldose 1-epimerase family protein [Schleiferilactobacillus perolens]|jgi:galactose mutarotase-like enzyme|uniref:aldose 1-epimerase family protein n=1 Tax=Schleiferilactobacillus perolens TaxID=100468 RepID=UPI0023554CF1|nr:aldose 1-epimerase family protein [Schleiferilactobacillus perolens]MCI2172242.1 aldose 1-epimerase family protein [Schleiferilactobacillus perolens]
MITIENDQFKAEINELGAELTHLISKKDNFDYIWNDVPEVKFWKRHAPILFPAIGRSNGDSYEVNGTIYPMTQHGFARDRDFTVTTQSTSQVVFTQEANTETRAVYPFDYVLEVTYTLQSDGLYVAAVVTNNGADEMPFALGFHPAFNVTQNADGSFADYSLTLKGVKGPVEQFGIGPVPYRDGTKKPLTQAKGDVIPLTHEFLDDGLVIIANSDIEEATLSSSSQPHAVTLDVHEFPYLTIWSPEHEKAPFICVEPFAGLPDQAGEPADWPQKAGNNIVAPSSSKDFAFTILPH